MATQSSDKYRPYSDSRAGPFLAVVRTILGFFTRLSMAFTLTEEERSQAGIYLNGEGHG